MKKFISLILFILATPAMADKFPVLLDKCPKGEICLQMDINLDKNNRNKIIEKKVSNGSYSDFILNVRGRLNNGPEKTYKLKYQSFTDGIECNDFGQGTVAVRGFSSESNPLVFTSPGILEITNGAIVVGCPKCAKLYEKASKKIVHTSLTPGWDLSLVGYRDAIITFNENKEVLFKDGDICISLKTNSPFQLARPEHCVAAGTAGHYKNNVYGFQLEPAEWIFDIKGSKYFLFLHRGACT